MEGLGRFEKNPSPSLPFSRKGVLCFGMRRMVVLLLVKEGAGRRFKFEMDLLCEIVFLFYYVNTLLIVLMFQGDERSTDLFQTILKLESVEECEKFFRDLMSISEIEAVVERWEVVKLVEQGMPYRKISEQTGASTATITRIAHWLKHGMGGYRQALDRKNLT